MTIYVTSSDISIKSDINRVMQENIKTAVERISEDVRKTWTLGVSNAIPDTDCTSWASLEWLYEQWDKLCTSDYEYFLGLKLGNDYVRKDNSFCEELKNNCVLVLKERSGEVLWPITNNLVSVKNLSFYTTQEPVAKVMIHLILQPAVRKWLKADLIEATSLNFQTTVSQRPF